MRSDLSPSGDHDLESATASRIAAALDPTPPGLPQPPLSEAALGPRGERWLDAGGRSGLALVIRVGHGATIAATLICLVAQLVYRDRPGWLNVLGSLAAAGPVGLIAIRAIIYREARTAWWWITAGLGLQLWGALFAAALGDLAGAGTALGWRDVFALPSLVALGLGVFLLTQTSLGRVHPSVRLDGLTVGLGAACIATAALAGPLLGRQSGDWTVSLTLVYPVIDLILVVMLLSGLAPRRYRPTWSSGLLMAAVAIVAVGSVLRLYQETALPGEQRPLHEATSLVGYALMALAAWAPGRYRRPVASVGNHDRHLAIPALSALAALVVLVASPTFDTAPITTVLAAATVALALGRTLWTARDLYRLHERARSAHTDELTQLPNRRAFFDQLDRRLEAPMVRHAVFVIDLDGFKAINDTYGHGAGDELLRCVAQRLQARLPQHVAIGRMGGDEFCAVAPVHSPEEALLFGRTITAALGEPFGLEVGVVTIGGSCGVALQPDHGDNRNELLHAADIAMYDAKRHRKGVVLYQAQQAQDPAPSEADLIDDIRIGLDEGRVEVHFQAVARTVDGQLCSLEALARFRHHHRGILGAAELLPLVGQGACHGELFSIVLGQTVRYAASLHRQHLPLPVSLNVSAAALSGPSAVAEIEAALFDVGLPASLLTIEVAESELATDPAGLAAKLATLRNRGIGVVIDDFRGGAACVDALAAGAVSGVKVGAALTEALWRRGEAVWLLEGLTHTAARFGVAIGVVGAQDLEALSYLHNMGIATAQGFGLAAPMSQAELLRHLVTMIPSAGA